MSTQPHQDRFKTYDQQMKILKDDKSLIINDEDFARTSLINIGYFSLVGGYKDPFKNPMTRKYINTTFGDIYALYKFDRDLRELSFRYLCEIEQKIRQVISYCFCSVHGDDQSRYLSPHSYRADKKLAGSVNNLIGILRYIANDSTEHSYLTHQRQKHKNVPLWVSVNALTFGQISKLYTLLPFAIQSAVAKEYPFANEKELEQYLRSLTLYRNVCAHNERLYCFRSRYDIPDTALHKRLDIPKNGNQYEQGKRDYFALVIALRYLLPDNSFKGYKKALIKLIRAHQNESSRLSKKELYSTLGLPDNWETITQYKR